MFREHISSVVPVCVFHTYSALSNHPQQRNSSLKRKKVNASRLYYTPIQLTRILLLFSHKNKIYDYTPLLMKNVGFVDFVCEVCVCVRVFLLHSFVVVGCDCYTTQIKAFYSSSLFLSVASGRPLLLLLIIKTIKRKWTRDEK